MLGTRPSAPTETTAFEVKVYTSRNAEQLTAEKRDQLADMYIQRYSSPKWSLPPEQLDRKSLAEEIGYAMKAKDGMIITIEDNAGNIVGFRLALGFSNVMAAAGRDNGIRQTVRAMRKAVGYDLGQASYTVDTLVLKEHEGEGLAHAMMQAHIRLARETGAPAIIGWTTDINARMIRLYDRNGYTPMEGLTSVTTGSDYNVFFQNNGKPSFVSMEYQRLTWRHLLLQEPLVSEPKDLVRRVGGVSVTPPENLIR